MRNNIVLHVAFWLLSIYILAGYTVNAHPTLSDANIDRIKSSIAAIRQDESCARFPKEQIFDNLQKALRSPEKVKCLMLTSDEALAKVKHLPPGLGRMTNLEVLIMACLEELEDIPEEIGNLKKMQAFVIDNGNGCAMNVSIPRSIGNLENLKVLRLYGAIDGTDDGGGARRPRVKPLPQTIGNLRRLELLDLGRNGLKSLPAQIASLTQLKTLRLEYNDIKQLPAFISTFTNLRELSLDSNGISKLPVSLAKIPRLKLSMGNNSLKLRDQKALRTQFPKITFSFENDYDDNSANEEARKPKRN